MSDADDLVDALAPVVQALRELAVPHFVGGSIASSFHGATRSTMDVDLICELTEDKVAPFVACFPEGFYISRAKHQDILEFMFEFSTRDTFGRASGVFKPQNSLNQSLKAVWREIDFGRLGRNYGRFLTVARSFRIAEVVGPGRSTFQLPDTTRAASRLVELNCVHFGFADDARGTGSFAVKVNS